jgi:hypothetical protein
MSASHQASIRHSGPNLVRSSTEQTTLNAIQHDTEVAAGAMNATCYHRPPDRGNEKKRKP